MTRGFSLIEVVVALVILSTGGAAALSLVVTANRRIQQAWILELALFRATEVADSLEAEGGAAYPGQSLEPWGRVDWTSVGTGLIVMVRLGSDSTRSPSIQLAVTKGS